MIYLVLTNFIFPLTYLAILKIYIDFNYFSLGVSD